MKKKTREKIIKILCWLITIYTVIVVGGLVIVNVLEDIYNVQYLTFWQTNLILLPTWILVISSFVWMLKLYIKGELK